MVQPLSSPNKNTSRLNALDALRGFDMFWIVCGEGVFHGFANAILNIHHLHRDAKSWKIEVPESLSFIEKILLFISNQLHHSPWNGFTCYDLIFPLFIFISGVSIPYSYAKLFNQQGGKEIKITKIYFNLIKRILILLTLGMIINGLFKFQGYEQTRFASVLGRIALATFFATIMYLNFSSRNQVIAFVIILISYHLLLLYVPVPKFGMGTLTPEGNLAAYIDRLFLPGKLHYVVYDPEGLLSTFPAIATALMGIFTGKLLQESSTNKSNSKKIIMLLIAGSLCIFMALLWNLVLPINKSLWSSSFVLLSGGISIILMGIFYFIIDVKQWIGWSKPFIWMGTNAILIYIFAHGFINFEWSSNYLFGGIIKMLPFFWQKAALWIGVLILQFSLLKFLYDKKWFLKI